MAYHGCIPLMLEFLRHVDRPSVIEIGVARGITFFPVLHFLSLNKDAFTLLGVDIKEDDAVAIMHNFFEMPKEEQKSYLFCVNSIQFLKENSHAHFDLALVDGDHNYYTVSTELRLLEKMMNATSMIICDDYHGRWSDRDLFYSSRETHKDVQQATPVIETPKHGVKAAVDDFVAEFPEWKLTHASHGEPVFLTKGNVSVK